MGTFGSTVLGEAFWFGLGVGEPKLSYCNFWAEAMPALISRAAIARITECVFIFSSLGRSPQTSG
jgi:hypothetical protein